MLENFYFCWFDGERQWGRWRRPFKRTCIDFCCCCCCCCSSCLRSKSIAWFWIVYISLIHSLHIRFFFLIKWNRFCFSQFGTDLWYDVRMKILNFLFLYAYFCSITMGRYKTFVRKIAHFDVSYYCYCCGQPIAVSKMFNNIRLVISPRD